MSAETTETVEATEADISPEQAAARIASGALLIDVRQDYEWEAGRIAEATHVPLEQLPSKAPELDRERTIVFQCRSGARSALATRLFREAGFDAYNLAGGLRDWVDAGRPIEPADGEVADPRPDAS